MQQGLVMTRVSGGKAATQWAEGPIRRSWLWGLKLKGEVLDIIAFRCQRCGLVEHYAEH